MPHKKTEKQKNPQWYLRIRRIPEGTHVDIWLIHRNGPAHCGLMWGEVLTDQAEQIVQVLGLPVEYEEAVVVGGNAANQKLLFGGASE